MLLYVCTVCNVLYLAIYVYMCMSGEHICRPGLLCDPVVDEIDIIIK